MKLENLLEAPIQDLPIEAKEQIAIDFEKVSNLAREAAKAVMSSDRRSYLLAVEELTYQIQKLKPQMMQK
jgi:hypothetical protein